MARRVANTKHFKVSQLLSEMVRQMEPGEPLPTVSMLKSRFACSQATISHALNRLRLQGSVKKPAGKKRLVVSQTGPRPRFQLALIRPLWASPDFDPITNRLYEMGHEEHFGFGVYIYSDVRDLNIEQALKQHDAGLVIGTLGISQEQINAVNGSRKPIVFLRDKPKSVRAGSVWVDDREVGRMATRHLLDLGHRRVAVMLSEPYNPSSTARLQGWKDALNRQKIAAPEGLIADCSVQRGQEAMSGSHERFVQWLERKPIDFTAIFCVGWNGALAALRAFRERKIRVPEDVSVITYVSKSSLCDFTDPALSTVQMDLEHYIRTAIRLVEQNLSGAAQDVVNKEIFLKPHVVQRASTAPPLKVKAGRSGRHPLKAA